jgi:hypothetical protein
MGYFGKQVGRPVSQTEKGAASELSVTTNQAAQPHFAAQVGKQNALARPLQVDRCPRCQGLLAEANGFFVCGGRCGRRWVAGGSGRWLDPATLPFGACECCRPRVPLVAAEVGAICPQSQAEYLILPEGVTLVAQAAPLGICRCCLPPQPLVQVESGLVCRNKPQQHYLLERGQVIWVGHAPAMDAKSVAAAIDAALSANSAEVTLFGLFAPPKSG